MAELEGISQSNTEGKGLGRAPVFERPTPEQVMHFLSLKASSHRFFVRILSRNAQQKSVHASGSSIVLPNCHANEPYTKCNL